jgi:hypothetical protein
LAEEIVVTIDSAGKVELQVKGAHGAMCLALTEEIENSLGEVKSRELCREYSELPIMARVKLNQQIRKGDDYA